MRNVIKYIVLSTCLLGMSWAADKKAEGEGEEITVPKVLSEVETLNVRPNLNAKYYVYLWSGSEGNIFKEVLTAVASEYPKMKKKGVELIMLCEEGDENKTKENLNQLKVKFPVVRLYDEKVAELPSVKKKKGGFPACMYVTPEGEMIVQGHGACVLDWEAVCHGALPKGTLQKKLKALKYISKKPQAKAKFYVYEWAYHLYGDDKSIGEFLDKLQEIHKEITAEKGELILFIGSSSPQVKDVYSAGKWTFPAVDVPYLEGCKGVPGLMFGLGAVVDNKGNLLKTFPSEVGKLPDWRDALEKNKNKDGEEASDGAES